MAPPTSSIYPRSRLSLPVLPHVPEHLLPVQEDLIPLALKSRKSQVQLSSPQERQRYSTAEANAATLHRSATASSKPQGEKPAVKREEHEALPLYSCTLCYRHLPPNTAPYILPRTHNESTSRIRDLDEPNSTGRILCWDCWIWVYSVSVCWTCGEIVGRKEERVGFGWCWWHWGCMGCLICKAPVKPPAWTGDPNGIELQDPPICMACIIDAEIDTEIAKEPNGIPEEKMKDQMVDLRTTASELLHQMRRTSALEGLSSSSRDRHMHSAPKKSMSRVGLDTVLEAPQKESKLYDGAATTSERTHTKTPKTELVHLTESPKILYTRPTYVSIFHPLEPSESYISSEHRPLPKWMVYLPSNRQSTIAGVRNPAAPMELPSQVRANLVQLSESLPKKQSQETCKTVAPPPSSEANGNAGSTTNVESPSPTWPATLNTSRRPSAFPFFQNPRPPMSPATESTWGPTMGPSSGMAPYIGIPSGRSSSVRTKPESVQEKSVPDKVHAIKSSAQILRSVKVLENCPVCDKAVDDCKLGRQHHRASEKSTPGTSSINIVRGCNSIPYHMACLTCHGCHVQFQPSESVSDWIWTDPKTCYHKTCLNPEVKPMLQSLVRKMSTRQVKTQQQHTDAGPLAAATNPQQEKAAVRDDPPFPIKLRSTGNGPDFHGVSRHNILSSFFSAGSTASSPRNSPRPAAKNEVQPRAALQHDRCVVCGLAIISQDSVISTGKKKAHERCVRKKKA